MNEDKTKPLSPAYIPFKTFINFINGLRDVGVPTQIDKSIMRGMSGGAQSAMMKALEFLRLVESDGKPTKELTQLIESEDNNRRPLLQAVLERAYPFLFSNSINLKRTTGAQVEETFRAQGVSGSTVVKCMAFFLTAAKAAGIEVSQHVKTPKIVRNVGRRQSSSSSASSDKEPDLPTQELPSGMQQLRLPLPGKPDVVLLVPEGFSQKDWAFLKPILEAYISRMFAGGAA